MGEDRDRNCRSSAETIRAALVGESQPGRVVALQQALALYDFYRAPQIEQLNAQI